MRAVVAAAALGAAGAARAQGWTHFAGDPSRSSLAPDGPPGLGVPSWVRGEAGGWPIVFAGQSGPVAGGGRAFAIGAINGTDHAVAMDLRSGGVAWTAPLAPATLNSWASPAYDAGNDAAVFATGAALAALAAGDGSVLWRAALPGPVVNASPVATTDRGAADRVFVTTFSTAGQGRLCCVNTDPFDAGANPFQPGRVLWSVDLGWSSGNTPAYHGGKVYVACVSDESGASPGRVLAFPADATSAPAPDWVFTNVKPAGFYGGVSVRGGAVYAASYAFSGGRDSANLVKLDAATGALRWSVGCNRTSATPVPLSDGRIAISTGLAGFGSAPAVQVFRDLGSAAALEWDTAADTWVDLNRNNRMDAGEYLSVGGWSVQPAVCEARGLMYCGALPSAGSPNTPCDRLLALDMTRAPAQAGFVAAAFEGAGSTPALEGPALLTIGAGGVHAFNVCPADCDRSTGAGRLDVFDFLCFQNLFSAGDPGADCDAGTGPRVLDAFDFLCFLNHWARGCP